MRRITRKEAAWALPLSTAMSQRGLNAEQLGDLVGRTRSRIHDLCSDREAKPDNEEMKNIANMLAVDANWLWRLVNPRDPGPRPPIHDWLWKIDLKWSDYIHARIKVHEIDQRLHASIVEAGATSAPWPRISRDRLCGMASQLFNAHHLIELARIMSVPGTTPSLNELERLLSQGGVLSYLPGMSPQMIDPPPEIKLKDVIPRALSAVLWKKHPAGIFRGVFDEWIKVLPEVARSIPKPLTDPRYSQEFSDLRHRLHVESILREDSRLLLRTVWPDDDSRNTWDNIQDHRHFEKACQKDDIAQFIDIERIMNGQRSDNRLEMGVIMPKDSAVIVAAGKSDILYLRSKVKMGYAEWLVKSRRARLIQGPSSISKDVYIHYYNWADIFSVTETKKNAPIKWRWKPTIKPKQP